MTRCERCGGSDLLVVNFDGLEGTTFVYCRTCEHRRWRRGRGEKVAVEAIIEDAASLPEARRGRRRKIAS